VNNHSDLLVDLLGRSFEPFSRANRKQTERRSADVTTGSSAGQLKCALHSQPYHGCFSCHAERMDTIPYLLPIVVVLAVMIVAWTIHRTRRASLPYTKRLSLLTAGELRFYSVLVQAVRPRIAVFVKVRLMDVASSAG
jgi:hypothetical protein